MNNDYIRINGEKLIPPFDFDTHEYHAISLNTMRPIEITVGNETQTIQLSELSPDKFIELHVNGTTYKLFTALPNMPKYSFNKSDLYTGDIYITLSVDYVNKPAYAYLIDNNVNLSYYRASEIQPFVLIDDNHYIMTGYYHTTAENVPWANKKVVAAKELTPDNQTVMSLSFDNS